MALTFESNLNGFCGGCRANQVALSSTRFCSPQGGVPNATEAVQHAVMPLPGTFRFGVLKTSSAQSGTGSMVFTWRKNAVDQALTITVAAGAGAGSFSDLTNSFSCVAGDVIAVKIVNNATALSAGIIGLGSLFHGTETSYSHMRQGIAATGNTGTVAASTTTYTDFTGSGFNATENAVQHVVPAMCSARDLYILTGGTQPATGSLVFTLRVNSVSTALVATISAGGANGLYFSTGEVGGIVQGDTIGLLVRNNATSTSTGINSKSVYLFDPKRRPRTCLTSISGNATVAGSSTLFTPLISGGSFNATETQRMSHSPATGVLKYFYLQTTTTQKAGGNTVFTVRVNQVDTTIVITVAANSAPGVFTDLTHTKAVMLGDKLTIKGVNSTAGVSCTTRFGIFLGE